MNWLTVVPVSVCMRRSSAGELVPLDLEIEATFRRNNAERKRKLLHDRTVASILEEAHFSESSSSNSPTSRESQTTEFEAEVMAEEQPRRVTLEDYSSTSVPQYFSSVARPEVQAQNLTYPPSLIQLI